MRGKWLIHLRLSADSYSLKLRSCYRILDVKVEVGNEV